MGGPSWQAEKELATLQLQHPEFQVVTLRCPTIIDSGRLGLLAILFEFIEDGKKVWVVGDGGNRYQFIYAQDLATACLLCCAMSGRTCFTSAAMMCRRCARCMRRDCAAGSKSRVARLPQRRRLR
jgi:UDP-glucose 4-epimerase